MGCPQSWRVIAMATKPTVPKELKGKLTFGDLDQIKALKKHVAEYEEYYGDGTEKRFAVHVELEYSETIMVIAGSAKEAEAKAADEFSLHAIDDMIDIHFDAEEVKEQD